MKKLYTNYQTQQKECGGGCSETPLPFAAFSKTKSTSGKLIPRSMCRKCLSRSTAAKQRERKLERFPKLYQQCDNDDCMVIFAKRLAECPKCRWPSRG